LMASLLWRLAVSRTGLRPAARGDAQRRP